VGDGDGERLSRRGGVRVWDGDGDVGGCEVDRGGADEG